MPDWFITYQTVLSVFVVGLTLFIIGAFAIAAFLVANGREKRPKVPKVHNRWPGI